MLKRVLRTTACGAVVGGAIGGYMYRARLLDNKAVQAKDFNAQQDMDSIRAQLSALLKNEENALPLQFFRYTTCPFCGKVSTFLQYHKIQHQNVEVDPMFKTQIKGHGYGKVPQLKFRDGSILVDSDEIVEIITRCTPDPKWKEQLSCEEINKWRSFASNLLVKYLVINVNESMFEAWRGYNYIDRYETIPYANKLFLKVLGAPVMFMVARYKTLPFLQKEDGYDPTTTTPRLALENQLRRWVSDGLLNGKKKFQGGKTPNLADIEVYGVLQSVRGHRVYDEIIANVEGMNHWLKNMESKLN